MITRTERVIDLLRDAAVPYEVLHHHTDYTAQRAAQDTHTPGRQFAKTVVLWIDNTIALAVLPASHDVDIAAFRKILGAQEVRLASEPEIAAHFPQVEVGALPPFGAFFDVPVYIDLDLDDSELVTFCGGSHRDSIRMIFGDFLMLAGGVRLSFSRR